MPQAVTYRMFENHRRPFQTWKLPHKLGLQKVLWQEQQIYQGKKERENSWPGQTRKSKEWVSNDYCDRSVCKIQLGVTLTLCKICFQPLSSKHSQGSCRSMERSVCAPTGNCWDDSLTVLPRYQNYDFNTRPPSTSQYNNYWNNTMAKPKTSGHT